MRRIATSIFQKWIKKRILDNSCNKGLDKYMNKIMEIDHRIKHYETNYKVISTSHAVSIFKREILTLHATNLTEQQMVMPI